MLGDPAITPLDLIGLQADVNAETKRDPYLRYQGDMSDDAAEEYKSARATADQTRREMADGELNSAVEESRGECALQ